MDFGFDDDQLALRDTIAAFCTSRADRDDAATWDALAGIGVFGLLLPEGGLGAVEAAIVFEQLGAYLVAGPLLWSTIAAPLVPDTARITGVDRRGAGTGPVVIEHIAESDVLVIVRDDRVERCAVSDLRGGVAGEPLDPLTPATQFDAVPAGDAIGDAEDARRIRLAGTVLAAATLVGVAQGALDVARDYSLERHQFGVPIGSFQAVKHLLADCYVRTELARSAVYAAAALADADAHRPEAIRAAGTAKLLAGEAGIGNGRTAVQVLGGMGFTWEMRPHYYLKRAWVLEESFGTGDEHALALSEALATDAAWT